MNVPDVVGTAEAAQILGVKPPMITRWRKSGRMPPPVAELAATVVWLKTDVQARSRGTGEFEKPDPVPFVGLSEVADMLKVDKSQVGRWRRTNVFPEPRVQLASGPLWFRSDIHRFTPPAERRRKAAA